MKAASADEGNCTHVMILTRNIRERLPQTKWQLFQVSGAGLVEELCCIL